MNRFSLSLASALLGIALGGLISSRLESRSSPVYPGTSTAKPFPDRQPGRTRATSSHDLRDVAACRQLIAESEIANGKHPLLRCFDRLRAIQRWVSLDPASALAEAQSKPSDRFAKELFAGWAALDPGGAMQAFDSSNHELMKAVAAPFFVALLESDSRFAAENLIRIHFLQPEWMGKSGHMFDSMFHQQVFEAWMKISPDSAVEYFTSASLNKDIAGIDVRSLLLPIWARQDFTAAWEYSKQNQNTGWYRGTLLAQGILSGSPEAMEHLMELAERDANHYNGSEIAYSLSQIDPHKALEITRSLPEGSILQRDLLTAVAYSHAASDPDQALALLRESGGSPSVSWQDADTLKKSFASLAARDPEEALSRISQLPKNQIKDAFTGMLGQMIGSDPETAMDRFAAWGANPDLAPHLSTAWQVAFSWSHGSGIRDPREMLTRFPELNDAVDYNVLSTWTQANPEAATEWIADRLEQQQKVPVVSSYGQQGVITDLTTSRPDFTAQWIVTLPEGEFRTKAANTLIANWAAFDPTSARTWINSLPPGNLRDSAESGLQRVSERRPGF